MTSANIRPLLAVRSAIALPVLAVVAGCGTLVFNQPSGPEIDYMDRAEFRDYTEQVFRRHNAVQSRLMMTLPDIEQSHPRRYQRLMREEQKMMQSCQRLNEAVAAHIDGDEMGFFRRLKFPLDVTDCERRTAKVEASLEHSPPQL